MLGSKSSNRILIGVAAAALALGAAFAANAQVKAPGFTGHGPVTPPQDPGLCMAQHVLDPNKWSICGVTPPKNRNISVVSATTWLVKVRMQEPSGSEFTKTLTQGTSYTLPYTTTANVHVHAEYVNEFGQWFKACDFQSADHGAGNITATVTTEAKGAGDHGVCSIAP